MDNEHKQCPLQAERERLNGAKVEGGAIGQLRLKQAQKMEELRGAGLALAAELTAKKALHKNFRGVLLQLRAKV